MFKVCYEQVKIIIINVIYVKAVPVESKTTSYMELNT